MAFARWLLGFLLLADGWEYRPELGYVHAETLDRYGPQEFYEFGLALAKESRTDEALEVFSLVAVHGPEPGLKEKAFYKRAEALWSAARYGDSHRAFEAFVTRYPDSERADRAKERAMWCALQLARVGAPRSLLGVIPAGTTSSDGVELLREFLRRYPRESFSAKYYLLLGEFLLESGEEAEAEAEFTILIESYNDPASRAYAARALVHLAEVEMKRFRGLEYDARPLREAKRHYQRYLDTEGFRTLNPTLTRYVEQRLEEIDGRLAEQHFRVAEYYASRGWEGAARLYLETLPKMYPGTAWARLAARRLQEKDGEGGGSP